MHAPLELPGDGIATGVSIDRVLARSFMAITCFCWGTSQIAPPGAALDFSLGKMNVGDVFFVALCIALAGRHSFRRHVDDFLRSCRSFVILVIAFCGLGVLSSLANSFPRDLNAADLLEVVRPGYYLLVVLVICYWVRYGRVAEAAVFFPLGILAASVNNFVLVLAGEVEATSSVLQLYNRNVVGNLLAVGLIFLTIAFHKRLQLSAFFLACGITVLVVFSFSKGAWVMGLLGLSCYAAVYLDAARTGQLRTSVRTLTRLCLVAVVVVAAFNVETIGDIIELKIEQSFTTDLERSQSTVALRLGHLLSSLEIVAQHPLLGVGVTNWEAANDLNAYWLNDIFLVNDNPHNGFLYILSGMGFPALLIFMAITAYPAVLLPRALGMRKTPARVYRALLFTFLFVSGNFMLHLLSHYFLWLLCGTVFGLCMERQALAPVVTDA